MSQLKLEFSNDVIRIVHDLCKLVFNLSSDQEVQRVFGINNEQMEKVIKTIIDSMPDAIFELTTHKIEEIKSIFAKEFIFFQVQEKLNDPNYENDLSNFIYAFSRDIQSKFSCMAKEQK